MLHIVLGEEEFVPAKDPKWTFSNYSVSNKGRVRNNTTNHILKPILQKRNGYYTVSLIADEDYTNGRKTRRNGHTTRIHKLVTNSFLGIKPDNLVVNHKNGDKSCNELSNLEYCTQLENNLHAIRTGLKKPAYGPHKPGYQYSDDMVRCISESLVNGEHDTDIAKKYGVSCSFINNIKRHKYRYNVTKEYNLDQLDYKKKPLGKRLSEDTVHRICKYLESSESSISKAAKLFNVTENMVGEILYGRYMPEVSSQYDMSTNMEIHNQLTEDTVRLICVKLQDGISVKKIARQIGVAHSIVSAIRNGKYHTEISKDYDFSKCMKRQTIDKDLAISIAEELQNGVKPKDIAKKLSVDKDTVKKVKLRRLGRPWTDSYTFK